MKTPKRAAFVKEYLFDLNATRAAIRAGYSERTARQQGAALLSKVDIAAEVARALGITIRVSTDCAALQNSAYLRQAAIMLSGLTPSAIRAFQRRRVSGFERPPARFG